MRIKGLFPYLVSVFASSFIQMGLFLFFEQWVKYSRKDAGLLIGSSVLQAMSFVPYLLWFPIAGFLADRFGKGKVVAWSSLGQTAGMIAVGVLWAIGYPQIAVWFVPFIASAFAVGSPAKYGIVKEMFGSERLSTGIAHMFSMMIVGALVASVGVIGLYHRSATLFGVDYLLWILVGASVLSSVAAFFIPRTGRERESLQIRSPGRIFHATWYIGLSRVIITGLAVFWGLAQVFVMLSWNLSGEGFIDIVRNGLVFSAVGMIFGGYLASRSSHLFIEVGLIPVSVLGCGVCAFFIPFVDNPVLIRMLYAFLGLFFGALGTVLNSLLLLYSRPASSGRIVAVSNMVTMLFLVFVVALEVLLLKSTSLDRETFLFLFSLFLFAAFVWAFIRFPQSLLRTVFRAYYMFRYDLKITGNENIPIEGPVLLIGNHTSAIDWILLQMASPRSLRMAVNEDKSEHGFSRWILRLLGAIRINRRNPEPAMAEIRKALLHGEAVVVFPEGELSKSCHIGRFSIDYSSAIRDTDVKLIPFYIQGVWGGKESYASESVSFGTRLTRIVSIAFGKEFPADTAPAKLRNILRELSMSAWAKSLSYYPTIVPFFLAAAKRRVRHRVAIYSPLGNHLTGYGLVRLVLNFSRAIRKISHREKNVGFMLPPSPEGISLMLSIWSAGKTSVNLNYTSGVESVLKCVERTEIQTVFTSRAFLDKLQKRGQDYFVLGKVAKLVCVEDLEKSVGFLHHVLAFVAAVALPSRLLEFFFVKSVKPDDVAVILFSSGSEGTPKGVMLSHRNLVSNTQQANAVFTLRPNDVMLAELPIFHSFGLTVTVLLPLFEGIPLVTCAEPTDVKTIARVCAEFRVSILVGTPTFLRAVGLNRWVHPMCLKHLRLVLSGAERLRPEIRDLFARKFKKEIYEGYGCTETAPIATFNTEDVLLDDFLTMEPCSNLSSVGMPIPGVGVKIIDPVSNRELFQGEEGMILIGGPQVMKGYFKDPERTKNVILEIGGHRWYKTGDKGKLDEDGFVIIVDRYSRFAKLGGEMISLGAVEGKLNETKILEGFDFIIVAIPDEIKGERIVLLYSGEKDADEILRELRKSGIPQLMIPGAAFRVPHVPKLGSGKADFTTAKKMAVELCAKK